MKWPNWHPLTWNSGSSLRIEKILLAFWRTSKLPSHIKRAALWNKSSTASLDSFCTWALAMASYLKWDWKLSYENIVVVTQNLKNQLLATKSNKNDCQSFFKVEAVCCPSSNQCWRFSKEPPLLRWWHCLPLGHQTALALYSFSEMKTNKKKNFFTRPNTNFELKIPILYFSWANVLIKK